MYNDIYAEKLIQKTKIVAATKLMVIVSITESLISDYIQDINKKQVDWKTDSCMDELGQHINAALF